MGAWHGHAIRRAGGTVVAILDPNEDAARELARRHAGAQVFTRPDDLFGRTSLDVLHVCTPEASHVALAEQAFQAGCHVLVEKPMARTQRECVRLLAAGGHAGRLLSPTHQFVFQKGVQRALGWVGHLGGLVHVEALFCSAGAAGAPPTAMDCVVADLLPHPLSLFHAFVPGGLAGIEWHARRIQAGELRVLGVHGQTSLAMTISMQARPTACSMRLFGRQGTIAINLFHGYALRFSGRVSRVRKALQPLTHSGCECAAAAFNLASRWLHREPAYPGLNALVARFHQAVRDRSEPPLSRESILAVAQARDLLREQAGLPGAS